MLWAFTFQLLFFLCLLSNYSVISYKSLCKDSVVHNSWPTQLSNSISCIEIKKNQTMQQQNKTQNHLVSKCSIASYIDWWSSVCCDLVLNGKVWVLDFFFSRLRNSYVLFWILITWKILKSKYFCCLCFLTFTLDSFNDL